MKLTLILICLSLQVSAIAYSQRITVNFKTAPVWDALRTIQKQTGYSFIIDQKQLQASHPVTLSLKQASIEETLQLIFKDQPFEYRIQGQLIMIRPKSTDKTKNTESTKDQAFQDLSGTVLDSAGNAIAGATVVVIGVPGKGASTDGTGRFYIKNTPSSGSVLVTIIGYESRTVTFAGGTVTIILKNSISPLDEVRVIAYGTTSRRVTTGNIGGIGAKELETQPIANPILGLAGRVAGINVTQNTGLSGSGVTIRIQGINSIGRGTDPFYVVDGVPYIQQVLPTLGTNITGASGDPYLGKNSGNGNPFNYLNPADIESIEVLKDADATAIYGSRAANGAILITTKKGKPGRVKVDVSMQQGAGKVAHKIDMLNTEQYLMMRKEAYTNDGREVPNLSTPSKNPANYDLTYWDQGRYTDWQKVLIGGTAQYSDIQAALSGGTVQTTFRLNAAYHRETTVFPGSMGDNRASVGVNINHSSLNQRFKAQFTANYLADVNKLPSADLTIDALYLPPNAPALYKADGTLNWERILQNPTTNDSVSTFTNPLAVLKRLYQNKTNNLVSSLDLSFQIADGLTFKSNFGYTNTNTNELSIQPTSGFAPEFNNPVIRTGSYGNGYINSWIIEPQLNYRKGLFGGTIDVLLGSTFQSRVSNLSSFSSSTFISDELIANPNAGATVAAGDALQSEYRYNALFGRINYNFQDKYILNLTARRDGSSRFGIENQFHNFGAIGAAWLFSNEDLIKNNLPFLSFGKLRGSYGTTGNDQIGDYSYLNLYSNTFSAISYQNSPGIRPAKHANPYLQWELTKKLQAGIDLGFMKDRLLLNVNYYRNRSNNQLLPYALPITTGFINVDKNFPANVQNSGWEFTLNTINVKHSAFTWSSSLNMTVQRNKLLSFPGLETSNYANQLIIGQSVRVSKYYRFAGVNPTSGTYEFFTADGKVTATPDGILDRTVVTDLTLPKFFGGLQNSFSYKGFQLDVLFQYVKQYGPTIAYGITSKPGILGNQPVDILNRWQSADKPGIVQKFSTLLYTWDLGGSDAVFMDASFLRLKNASFSYTLPGTVTRKIHLDNLRVFLHGQNLLTFTKYKGLDPENLSLLSLPPLRVWTFGIQASL